MDLHLSIIGDGIAVVAGIVETEPGIVEAGDLGAMIAGLAPSVTRVILLAEPAGSGLLARLSGYGRTLATGRHGVDAIKRVEAGRVVGTVDRSRLFTAQLPAVVDRTSAAGVLSAGPHQVAIADLAFHDGDALLVDDQGEPIALT